MPNFNYAYYAAWRADVSAAVVLSVSLYTGIPLSRISVVSEGQVEGFGEGSNGTVLCVEVQSYTPEQSASVQLLIDGIGAGGSSRRIVDKALRYIQSGGFSSWISSRWG
jgi:hypothetical protein